MWFRLRKYPVFSLIVLLFEAGCTNANLNWSSIYHLAFQSPLDRPFSSSSATNARVQVAVLNSSGSIATSAQTYTVSLAVFSDSNCTQQTMSSIGSAQTSSGIATITPSSVPSGTFYLQASASGLSSVCSYSISIGPSLVVPIEMLDYPAGSNIGTSTTFDRSQTSLNTSAYDGQVSYYFEVVALNTSATSYKVYLVSSSGSVLTSVSVPASTNSYTRFRSSSFTPTTGSNIYRVQLDGTGAAGDLQASAARMIVTQSGASKTKLYIPLTQFTYNSYSANDNSTAAIFNSGAVVAATASQATTYSTLWPKNSGTYASLSGSTPWTFEAVVSATSSGTAYATLENQTMSMPVSSAVVSTTSTTPTLLSASFSDSAANFTTGNNFGVTAYSSSSSFPAYIYKAGLWVSLSGITAAEIYNRVSLAVTTLSGVTPTAVQRIYYDPSLYTNPSAYFESTALASISATSGIQNCSNSDSSTVCTNSANVTVGTTLSTLRTSTAFSVSNGDRLISYTNVSAGNINLAGGFVVIKIQP